MNGGVLRPSEVSEQSFDLVRKGYDPVAVKAFLQRLRGQIEAHTSREEDLERRLAEAERRADNPELDHDTLTKGLGHEMAQVLGAAQEAGRAVLARAEAEAEGLVELARAEASRLTGLAGSVLDDRTREAEGAARVLIEKAESRAGGLLEVARTEAAAIVEAASAKAATRDGAAKAAAAAVVEAARREGGEMIAEARELRTRVLTDLAKRRRLLHLQVERLRAARESLTEVVRSSRVTFGALDEGLARAEGDARLAAEAAVRQVATESEPEVVAELESALVLARHADLVGTTAAARRQRRLDQPAPAAPVAPEPEPAAAAPEPEPEPAAAAAPEPAAGVADAVEVVRPVDTLFARLRAERSRARSDGGTEQDSNEEAPDTEPAGLPDPIEAESALQVRDAAIERVVSALARRLKRALQDDQNALLDQLRVRADRSKLPVAGLFTADGSQAQLEHFRQVSAELLIEAAGAGADLGAGGSPRSHQAEVTDAAGGLEADELADALGGALQRRLSQVMTGLEGADEPRLAELIGVAYREWKGERIEGLAGDHVVAAFGRGFLSALPPTALLRWVVDDGGGQCPDCDDNALSGPQAPGETYPTGQTYPPAHPGCRCLLTLA